MAKPAMALGMARRIRMARKTGMERKVDTEQTYTIPFLVTWHT